MSLNQKKIVEIVASQVGQVEERFAGYRDELMNTLAEIIEMERAHKVSGFNIQQRISDKCNALGGLVACSKAEQEGSGDSQ